MQSDGPAANRASLEALTGYLKANLLKTAVFAADAPARVFAETAERFNETQWFWTDDNAKAAELLAEPAAYDADPAACEAAIDFVLRMSGGAVIRRRGGPAELRVVRSEAAAFRVETAFFIVEGDLTRGIVRHALRFNDARTVTAAVHGGEVVSAVHAGKSVTADIAHTIVDCGVALEDRAVVLTHTSALRSRGGALLCRVTYRYRISADRPSIALSVALAVERGVRLDDVILTTALHSMAAVRGVNFRALAVRAHGVDRLIRRAPIRRASLHAGPADYAAAVQEGGAPGFNYALHMLLADGDRLVAIAGRGRGGRLHGLVNRYAIGTISAEGGIQEERMLTGGGYYDVPAHYEAVMREAAGGGEADPSMSYDIGAELNAVAVHLLFARAGRYAQPPSPARLAELTEWYDRHVERYFAFIRPEAPDATRRVFTRGIAFVVMSLDCMLRATDEARYRAWLQVGVGLILRLVRRRPLLRDRITFGDAWSPLGRFLDCHAACILALARASWHGDPDGTLGRTVQAGIRGIRFYKGEVTLGPTHRVLYDGLAVRNRRRFDSYTDTGFWSFKLGLVLRAVHATERAARAGHIAMSASEAADLAARRCRAETLLLPCCRWHGDTLEVLTSPIAGETNSETQPWVALGLVPRVDETIEACWASQPTLAR